MSFVAPPFSQHLFEELLALNNANAAELSYKTAEQFRDLLASAHVVLAEEKGVALLVGFRDDSHYDNPNFHWLTSRYNSFMYIDRVVVSAAARGRGLAKSLYLAIEQRAREECRERLVCEINFDPPNPASDAFHHGFGFVPVGNQQLAGTQKTVRYWSKALD